ncbi:MAG TPA: universal stress protein [Chloroflexota bacterium]|nr:universal stress protein [Chloroflexota bacterium]
MSTPTSDRRPILVPLDGSPLAEKALRPAAVLARRWGAPLVVVRVVEPRSYGAVSLAEVSMAESMLEMELAGARAYVEGAAQTLAAEHPGLEVSSQAAVGDAGRSLIEIEERVGARLVAMTTHGRTGLARWARGSVAETVLRLGAAPVLLIRPWDQAATAAASERAASGGLRVLVPLDGSPMSQEALPLARELAAGEGGALILTGIVKLEDERAIGPFYRPHVKEQRRTMREYLGRLCAEAGERGVAAHSVVGVEHDVATAIADLASVESADVIVMSTHGRGAIGRLLYGSIADRVTHVARVPVLLYRPHAVARERGAPTPAPVAESVGASGKVAA